jgi:2-methylcitrate dehydratase PrpD
LAKRTTVIADDELNKLFPDYYASIVQISTKAGATLERRSDIARGYPETALSEDELDAKFRGLAGSVASSWRVDSLSDCLNGLENAPDVSELASLLTGRPDA